jgi:cell division protein FtsL
MVSLSFHQKFLLAVVAVAILAVAVVILYVVFHIHLIEQI